LRGKDNLAYLSRKRDKSYLTTRKKKGPVLKEGEQMNQKKEGAPQSGGTIQKKEERQDQAREE